MRFQNNPIGLMFVTHNIDTHLIRAFLFPGCAEERRLCGSDMPATTIRGYVEGGEFDCAGNPMPTCEACKSELENIARCSCGDYAGHFGYCIAQMK